MHKLKHTHTHALLKHRKDTSKAWATNPVIATDIIVKLTCTHNHEFSVTYLVSIKYAINHSEAVVLCVGDYDKHGT